jgi:NADH dehydrogenase
VVIIGSGFGGLFAAKALRRADVEITMVSSVSHHLFQPLLYQVATGVLSTGEIAPATREILSRQGNVQILLGTVEDVDPASRRITASTPLGTITREYDSLIVAAGSGQSYFGNEHFAEFAPGLKSIDDALELRGRIFGAFEAAELTQDEELRQRLMTFVVVGAGPTGVEMAGQIAELSRRTLRRDFRHIDPTSARVILVDAVGAPLSTFGDHLSDYAAEQLDRIGVDLRMNTLVVGIDALGVDLKDASGTVTRVAAATKVWAAGVQAAPLANVLAEKTGAAQDRAGRIVVESDCSLPGYPEIFVVGDLISHLPGVAQVAMQSAKHAARQIVRGLHGETEREEFRYRDKGSMATITRFHAVASVGRTHFHGLVAWFLWLFIHLIYLIGFKSRITTLLHWAVSFFGRGRAERAGTTQQVLGRLALKRLQADQRWDLPE